MKTNILFVDDEEDIVKTFERTFRKHYNVYTATSAEAGLKIIQTIAPLPLIISDFAMPQMNGIEFLSKSMLLSPDSIRIMLTGYADLSTILDAINENKIYKFLLKPVPTDSLKIHIEDALENYRLKNYEKEMNRLKSIFLTVVSRNYKNPLTGIMNSSYLLKEVFAKADKTAFEKIINNIQVSVLAMSSVIDKIITMSTLETSYIVNKKIYDLGVFTKEIISVYQANNKRRINFIYKNNLQNSNIEIDINLFNIIMDNVIDNAVKFSPEMGDISICLEKIKNRISITIADKGCGISDSEKPYVFNPFYKTNINEDNAGTGLGLTIVKKAIELLHGEIEIKSDLSYGTEIILYF